MFSLIRTVLGRFVSAVVIVSLFLIGLAGYELYLKGFSPERFPLRKLQSELGDIQTDIRRYQAKIGRYQARLERINAELARIERFRKKYALLKKLKRWLTRTPDAYQEWKRQKARKKELLRRKALIGDILGKYQQRIKQRGLEKLEKETEIQAIPETVRLLRHLEKRFFEYIWLIALFVFLFVVPVGRWAWKSFCWYGPGAWLDRFGRPLVFFTPHRSPLTGADLTPNRVSHKLNLAPGEEGVFKAKVVPENVKAEANQAGTELLFRWRYPLLSLVCGLFALLRFRARGKADPVSVVVSNMGNPDIEFSVITLKPDVSVILRPSFVAGLIYPLGKKPRIRSHWFIFRWHAWITLQFRYIEFCGPARIVAWGFRGLRAESGMDEASGQVSRINPERIVGFSPHLRYRSRRSEALGTYLFAEEPLFNDSFTGTGVYICQETAVNPAIAGVRRFWAGFFDGLLRLAGF